MTIKILKLASGEEVIGDITFSDPIYKVVKPFVLQMARDPNSETGQMQLALFPYAPYTKEHTVRVRKENTIWVEELPESMLRDYNTALVSLSVVQQEPANSSDVSDVLPR
jgi:hypothetical protein